MRPKRLRIESQHHSPINDYRIREDRVEMRSLDDSGHPYPAQLSDWKTLDESEVALRVRDGCVKVDRGKTE